jgi:hypothetical protein
MENTIYLTNNASTIQIVLAVAILTVLTIGTLLHLHVWSRGGKTPGVSPETVRSNNKDV